MRCDRVHQRWRQAIVRLESNFFQPVANALHLRGRKARLDDRRDKGREFRGSPAGFGRQFRMDKIEPVEWVAFVLNPAEHMNAAGFAGMPLNGRFGIDHRKVPCIMSDTHLVARNDRYDGEYGPLRFPTLRTAARVVMRDLTSDGHFDGVLRALADQRSTCEVCTTLLNSVVDRWMKQNLLGHGSLPVFDFSKAAFALLSSILSSD